MKSLAIILAGILFALSGGVIGYRIGTGHWPALSPSMMADRNESAPPEVKAATANQPILYWKDPDGKPAYSAAPAKTPDGRDFIPVHDDEEPNFEIKTQAAAASPDAASGGERKVKYYRNPMGLPDTSPVPKKDWMGMDYIAVYDGEEEEDGSTVKVSLDKVQRAGVRSETVELRHLAQPVRAPAVAKIDERTLRDVTLRTDGYIEKLYVAESGKHVTAGEPLFRVYSPDIVKAEVDYQIAKSASEGRSRSEVAKDLQGAARRLENLDVPQSVIKTLESSKGATPMAIDWPSPATGVVIEKKVVEGQKAMSGDLLYRIGDLTKIWVIADVAERDFHLVTLGAPATITFQALPNEEFKGTVSFILHELDMQTRTAKVRIEVPNPDHRIKHDMFADVVIDAGDKDAPRIAVPNSSILNSGVRQVVLVDKGEGRFEPRDVKLGVRGAAYTEVVDGVKEGEKVVVSANFLIDAESNLKAALSGFTAGDQKTSAPNATEPAKPEGPDAPANPGPQSGKATDRDRTAEQRP